MPIISGGGRFNGGTITQPVLIDTRPDAVTIPFRVRAGSSATVGFDITFDPSTPAITVQGLDAYGKVILSDDFSADVTTLAATGAAVSNGLVQSSLTATGLSVTGAVGTIGYIAAGTFAKLANLTEKGIQLGVHAAPANGDLDAGDLYLWFDQTNTAGKLMVKAKTADSTVVTASIPLT